MSNFLPSLEQTSSPNSSHSSNTDETLTNAPAFSPLYQQIKTLLLQSLQAAEWKPGESIPSEMELAARYRVSQGTVRKAIDELATENLLVRRQGKGTFVATHSEQTVQYRFLKLKADDSSNAQAAERHILSCQRIRANAEIAPILALKNGDSVIHIKRILSFSNVPTILEEIWLNGLVFKGLSATKINKHEGPTYALFELDFGVRMVRAEEKLKAVLPNAEQAKWLQIPLTTPLLQVERIAFTYNNRPMEWRSALYRTDVHHYFNTLN